MLKFLRKNQKWMLVIFCGALMVAFLIPQAVSQFAPNPAKDVMATTYDGQEIIRKDVQRVSADVQMLRRLRVEAIPSPDVAVLPQTGSERNDALSWIMIQHAAERNGLGASRQEAFNLIATLLGMQDFESLDNRAKEMGTNGDYLIELGKQYLKAEQYRQLVAGTEYNLPKGEDSNGSPGLRRVVAMLEANQLIQQLTQNPQQLMQMAMTQGVPPQQLVSQLLVDGGYLERIQGHERFSATELRYALQQQFAELDLTVVVLDAENRIATTSVDDAYVQGIFEKFADDAPGTGQPYGLGYREPDKAQFEAIRIPIDAARDAVAKTITPKDVREFYNQNRDFFIQDTPEGEEPSVGPAKLTPELRDQIRLTLTEQRANELVKQIAQEARLRLNEDARGLPDDGPYKQLPDDFQPTSLPQLVSEIEAEHGITPQIILIDEFVSSQDIIDASAFTQAWLSKMPTANIQLPNEQFGFLADTPVPQAVLGGRAGLFATTVAALSQPNRRPVRLADYLTAAKPFLSEEDLEQGGVALQVGLPGEHLRDATGSTYVFRITQTQPARPATDMTPIAEKVREDAIKIKAYEELIAEEDALLKRAAEQSIERLMPDANAKTTLSGLTRGSINQPFAAGIAGVGSTGPIIERAFQITDDLLISGGLDQAADADRLFAVELPGDYKIALVRIDTFRPMTRARYEEEAVKPAALMQVTGLGMTELPEPPLSFEALKRYTNFKWADGFGDEEDENEEGEEEAAE